MSRLGAAILTLSLLFGGFCFLLGVWVGSPARHGAGLAALPTTEPEILAAAKKTALAAAADAPKAVKAEEKPAEPAKSPPDGRYLPPLPVAPASAADQAGPPPSPLDASASAADANLSGPDQAGPTGPAYAVEIGIFHELASAQRLSQTLQEQGFATELRSLKDPNGQWIGVTFGRFISPEAAETALARLRRKTGHNGRVILLVSETKPPG